MRCVQRTTALDEPLPVHYIYIYTVSQKHPHIFDCNLKKDYQTLIMFGWNIPDTTGHRMAVQFPTSPNVCFCTTWGNSRSSDAKRSAEASRRCDWGNRTNEILHFYPRQYYCLIKVTPPNISCLFGWQFIQLSVFFSTAYSKMLEMSVHYVNTGTETLSPFVDSSVDNVLLQTHADFSSRFLNVIW